MTYESDVQPDPEAALQMLGRLMGARYNPEGVERRARLAFLMAGVDPVQGEPIDFYLNHPSGTPGAYKLLEGMRSVGVAAAVEYQTRHPRPKGDKPRVLYAPSSHTFAFCANYNQLYARSVAAHTERGQTPRQTIVTAIGDMAMVRRIEASNVSQAVQLVAAEEGLHEQAVILAALEGRAKLYIAYNDVRIDIARQVQQVGIDIAGAAIQDPS